MFFQLGKGFLMTIRRILWNRALWYGGGTVTSLLLGWTGSGVLHAQTSGGVPSQGQMLTVSEMPRNYLNKNVIQLPIQIDAASRARIQEIHLYIKDSLTAPWSLSTKVRATESAFTIQLPRDGEYWFTMVTVDKQGRSTPSDLTREPAGLNVVIDTQQPQIELLNLGATAEGHLIQCDVSDANLDSSQTRVFFQGGDNNFRQAEALPGRSNVFLVPAQAVFSGMVRVTAQDHAKNEAQREMHISKMPARNVAAAAANPQQDAKRLPVTVVQSAPDLTIESPVQRVGGVSGRPDGADGPRLPDSKADSKIDAKSGPSTVTTPHAQNVEQVSMKRQIVNSARLFLDYQIENVGESGVGRVEVWITRDQAKSWQRLSEDKQCKSPVEVLFPGEGLYGVTLVASNGRGASAAPPAAGDTPDWWIEVDTTRPTAQITKVHSVTEDGKAIVHIHWAASDKNLGDTPVDLLYSSSPKGPWQPIAKGLKGEGKHSWMPPRDIGTQAHIQLCVRDQAGNTSVVQTLVPVLFDDPARPRAVIRGVTTGTSNGTGTVSPPPLQIVQPRPNN
jgi:hypothetical protein